MYITCTLAPKEIDFPKSLTNCHFLMFIRNNTRPNIWGKSSSKIFSDFNEILSKFGGAPHQMLRIPLGFFGIDMFFLVPPIDWLFCIYAPRSQGALLEVAAPARIFGNISGTWAGHSSKSPNFPHLNMSREGSSDQCL